MSLPLKACRSHLYGGFLVCLMLGPTMSLFARPSAWSASRIEFCSDTYVVREWDHVARVAVSRSGQVDKPAIVRYAVVPGTATPRADYLGLSGTLVFRVGERRKAIWLFVREDQNPEGLETVHLSLLRAHGSVLGARTNATLQILDDAPWICAFSPTSGVPGDQVDIHGLNFTRGEGVTSVRFNGVESSFVVVGPRLIQAAVPSGATTGPITVTSSFGTASSREPFVVLGPVAVVVTTTNDAGPGSLREAILASNARRAEGTNQIQFAIEAGLQTIRLASLLPPLTHPVVIDGTTQPGYSGTPIIELNATNAAIQNLPEYYNRLFNVVAAGCTIRGVIINNLGSGIAIALRGGHAVVEGSYIGLSAQGGYAGRITNLGIDVESSHNRIGGTTPAARNVISHTGYGIRLAGERNEVLGNFIGTDASGTQVVENLPYGLVVVGDGTNQIGGAQPGAGNLISGSRDAGVRLESSGNVIEGNFIGTDVTGTRALPNNSGIFAQDARGNLIGGAEVGAGNLISGNKYGGLWFHTYAEENTIQGNFIGTDVTGRAALGNGRDGVWPGRMNRLIGNSIFGNVGLGINSFFRALDGVTLNDPQEADGVQNFPILETAISAAGVTTLTGRLLSKPNQRFTLEFFSSVAPDPSGYGEGQFPLGTLDVTTDAAGTAAFSFSILADLAGQYATATAQDTAGNMSEFSEARIVLPP